MTMGETNDTQKEDIFEDARKVVEDSERLAEDVESLYDQVRETASIRRLYDRNPYAVLAGAAGVGYVLGGGLFTPFSKRVFKTGLKALVLPVALSKLRDVTQQLAKQGEFEELSEQLGET